MTKKSVQPAGGRALPAGEAGGKLLPVVIDTREQSGKGWTFEPCQVCVTRKKLDAGDYSLVGLEAVVALERKSLGDLVSTVIHDWIRFRKELVRLSGLDMAAVVVEADVSQVWNRQYESEAEPASVMGRCNSILIDHGIPVLWWGDRMTAARMAHRLLLLTWRKYHDATGLADPG